MPKPKVAVYGLTTEGYSLASKIIEKAAVTVVDETLQMAMELDSQLAKSHKSPQELVGDEALMGLKPVSQVLSEASVIFFAPKLRKTGDESVIEASSKLRDVSKYVSKSATVVNTLPTGVGGNQDNISFLEKQTGLKVGESLNYAYSPVRPRGEPTFTAVHSKVRDSVGLEELGIKSSYGSITSAELSYVSSVLSESSSMTAEIELMKKAREQDIQGHASERYVDDLASRIYDLTAIQASEDVGEPITYLATAAVKSLENYIRYVVDETRELLRELQLKASRTKVLVAWSIDRYEMRADRHQTSEALVERLRDYVTDVEHVQASSMAGEVLDTYKHNIVVSCSPPDYEWVRGLKKSVRGSEVSVLKATPSLQRE